MAEPRIDGLWRFVASFAVQAGLVVALVHLALVGPYLVGWVTGATFLVVAAVLSSVAVAVVAYPAAQLLHNLRRGVERFRASAVQSAAVRDDGGRRPPRLDAELEQLHARVLKRVGELQEARHAVRKESRAHRRLARHLTQAQHIARMGSFEWERAGNRVVCSSEIFRMFGFDAEVFVPTPAALIELVHRDDRRALRRWIIRLSRGETPNGLDVRVHTSHGELLNVHLLGEASSDADGKPNGVVGTVQDATERTRTIQQIHRLAYYDVLTELPNRLRFHEKLAETLDHARRDGKSFALMFLDLDQFKRINDTMGHAVGDDLLRIVAQRLTRVLRLERDGPRSHKGGAPERDVCRQGGDEFIVLLNGVSTEEQAARAGRRVLETLGQPITIGPHEMFVSASIGVVLYPRDGEDLDTLLKNADVAMYHAKSEGRNRYAFYRDSMRHATAERLSLEHDLRRAIENEQFELHYQPQIDVHTGELVGIEALIRWNHPTLGMVLPKHFIAAAEEAGLIGAIWEWVFVTALIQHNTWLQEGLPPMQIGVNLSSLQFGDLGLAERVREIAAVVGVPTEYVELEVTESAVMRDIDGARATLLALRAMGVKIAIDDFGTGYSSLACLRRLPLDKLKLDHTFTADAVENEEGAAIARAIVTMAEALGLHVVAEGVETQAQIDFLADLGCSTMQGFLLSRPLHAAAMTEFLRRQFHRDPGYAGGQPEEHWADGAESPSPTRH